MASWNCYVLVSSGSWCFSPLTAPVWHSGDWTLHNTRNNLWLLCSFLEMSMSSCTLEWHWGPATSSSQAERLKPLPHRWHQPGETSLPPLCSQWLQDSLREGRARHFGFGMVSRGAWMALLPAGLLLGAAQALCHPLGRRKHPWQQGRELPGKIPLQVPWKQARQGQRWHGSAPSSAGTPAKCLARALSSLDTGESTPEGAAGKSPPNQHKNSVHREREHWHCLNKHTHHEVLRGVRGFLDILIL